MRVLYLTLCIFLLDQASKLAVKGFAIPWLGLSHDGMQYASSIPVFGDWFKITFIENPNMAFGFDLGGKVFLALFAIVASAGMIWYLWKNRHERLVIRAGIAMILAGALGNLVDRSLYGVLYGYAGWFEGNVVDFLDLDLFTMRFGDGAFKFWPIFNIADAAVSIGVVQLVIFGMKPKHAQDPAQHPATQPGDDGPASS